MSQFFVIHPANPQPRLIRQAVAIVREGGVIAYPTDSSYALGCRIGDREAMEQLRRIRQIDEEHHFTLMCRDLAEISRYAQVDNARFRLLKAATPGCYTFILAATRELPRRILHPRRRSIGIRIPDHRVALALLEELNEPLLSTTLQLPGDEEPLGDPAEIRARLEKLIDLVIDAGPCGVALSTVVDLTGDAPVIVREGKGPIALFTR